MFLQTVKPSFDFVIDTTAGGARPTDSTFTLPFTRFSASRNYDMIIDWGDSVFEEIPMAYSFAVAKQHIYTVPGIYRIRIISESGMMPYMYFAQAGHPSENRLKLTRVESPLLLQSNNEATILTICNRTFQKCSNLVYVTDRLFVNNRQITDIGAGGNTADREGFFSYTRKLTNIGDDIFKPLTELTNINGLFTSTGLSHISNKLFESNTKIKTAQCIFWQSEIKSVDDFLFKHNTDLTNVQYAFNMCNYLKISPNIFCDDSDPIARAERFSRRTVYFNGFLNRITLNASSYGGQAPQLWNYAGTFITTGTFRGNDVNSLTNYNDIPEEWK